MQSGFGKEFVLIMNNKIKMLLIGIAIILLILFLYPKDAGGGNCGFCMVGEYKWTERNCLGFEQQYYPEGCADCTTDLICYGIPYGEKTCYDNSDEANRVKIDC